MNMEGGIADHSGDSVRKESGTVDDKARFYGSSVSSGKRIMGIVFRNVCDFKVSEQLRAVVHAAAIVRPYGHTMPPVGANSAPTTLSESADSSA